MLPLISPKTYGKLYPILSLVALPRTHGVSLRGFDLSLHDLREEALFLRENPNLPPQRGLNAIPTISYNKGWTESITSTLSAASSYVILPWTTGGNQDQSFRSEKQSGYWNRDINELMEEHKGKVPPLITELRSVILTDCTNTEGVFRRSSNVSLTRNLADRGS
jgi:hypothetical protein